MAPFVALCSLAVFWLVPLSEENTKCEMTNMILISTFMGHSIKMTESKKNTEEEN